MNIVVTSNTFRSFNCSFIREFDAELKTLPSTYVVWASNKCVRESEWNRNVCTRPIKVQKARSFVYCRSFCLH